jgi:hypothetical protein
MHEGARLRKRAGNVPTISSQQAYDTAVNHTSRTVSKHGNFYLVTSGRTSKRRNRCARTRYNSQYAKLSGEITKHAQKTKTFNRLLYAKATSRTFRESYQPALQSSGIWLEPSIRKEVVRPNENLFRKADEKGTLAHNRLFNTIRYELNPEDSMEHQPLLESEHRRSPHQTAAPHVAGHQESTR